MVCGKCRKDECGGDCAMDRYFKGDYKDRLIYASSGFRGISVRETLEDIEKLALDLPDVDYILDNIVNYMFTNSLTTDDFTMIFLESICILITLMVKETMMYSSRLLKDIENMVTMVS